jgi:hypothetical protein
MLFHEFNRYLHFSISSQQNYKPDPSETSYNQQSIKCPDNVFPEEQRGNDKDKLSSISIKPVLKNTIRPVIKKIYIFNKANRVAEKKVKQQKINIRRITREIINSDAAFY